MLTFFIVCSYFLSLHQMALRYLLLITVLLFCIAQVSSDVNKINVEHQSSQMVKGANRKLFPVLDCGGLCQARCRLHSRPNVCTRACGTCCLRCGCVPPGTSGNREVCGTCYTDIITHGNKTKCP